MRVDGFGGLRKAGGDNVAMEPQRLGGLGAARGNATHDGIGVSGDGVAR